MARVEDFTIRERNVLTLPQGVREESRLQIGMQGKAVAVGEGIVVLVANPALVDEVVRRVQTWLEERGNQDPWSRLNQALADGSLDLVPSERYLGVPEPDTEPNLDRIAESFGDDASGGQLVRTWRE